MYNANKWKHIRVLIIINVIIQRLFLKEALAKTFSPKEQKQQYEEFAFISNWKTH